MAFSVGDLVTPSINVTFSGELIPTAGASGTVLSRQVVGTTIAGEDLYSYYVDMLEDFPAASGTMLLSNFWFEESQLEGGQVEEEELFDLNVINQNLGTATQQASTAKSVVDSNLTQMDPDSPYYASNLALKAAVDPMADFILTQSVDTSTESGIISTAPMANRNALELGTSLAVLGELSDNLKGYHDAMAFITQERRQHQEQVDEQNERARQDDILNSQAYYQTYVEAEIYKGLLTPNPDANLTEPTEVLPSSQEGLESSELPDLMDEAMRLAFGDD